VEFNANWAKKAPVLVIAVAELAFAKNKAPNRNAQYDVGAASLQLALEATARGLVVHQMAGFDPETAKEAYDIPQGWEPLLPWQSVIQAMHLLCRSRIKPGKRLRGPATKSANLS